MLVVGVENTDRGPDMPVPGQYGNGGEEDFLVFLRDELLPAVRNRYPVANRIILTGHSQGGLFAHYAFLHANDVFDWIIALDFPLFPPIDHLMRDIASADVEGRLISVERTLGWGADFDLLSDWEGDRLAEQGLCDREGESHQSMTYVGTYRGLQAIFHDYAPTDVETRNLTQLTARSKTLSRRYGYEIPIARGLVERNIDDLLFQVRTEEAAELIEYHAARYPESDRTSAFRQRLTEAREAGPLEITVADLLAEAPPPIRGNEHLIGAWEGLLYAADGSGVPVEMKLDLRVENGRLTGTTTQKYPNGEPFVLENVMIRTTDDGALEWGYMNQMRPRGVIVTTARFDGPDRLVGTQEMQGVRMKFPPWFTPTEWIVELDRIE